MGTKIRIEVEIPMAREEYWPLIYTREFDEFQAPYISMKAATEVQCEADKDNSSIIRRRVKMNPAMELPSALLWYLGQEEFHYMDDQVKDLEAGVVTCRTTPPVLQDRVKIGGTVRVEPIDDSTCLHVVDFSIEISAFGLGGIIESVMATNVENSHVLIRKAVEAWKEYKRTGIKKQVGPEIAQELTAKLTAEDKSKIVFKINGVDTDPQRNREKDAAPSDAESSGISNYLGSWWS